MQLSSNSSTVQSRGDAARRLVLTAIWLSGFLICVVGIESYIGALRNGVTILLPEDRVPLLRPIAILYGGYLLGILGFWYKTPFAKSDSSGLQQIRFWLAFVGTATLNLTMGYLVWRNHFDPSTLIYDDVTSAVKICGLMSFLVAPANVYYFGVKPPISTG